MRIIHLSVIDKLMQGLRPGSKLSPGGNDGGKGFLSFERATQTDNTVPPLARRTSWHLVARMYAQRQHLSHLLSAQRTKSCHFLHLL